MVQQIKNDEKNTINLIGTLKDFASMFEARYFKAKKLKDSNMTVYKNKALAINKLSKVAKGNFIVEPTRASKFGDILPNFGSLMESIFTALAKGTQNNRNEGESNGKSLEEYDIDLNGQKYEIKCSYPKALSTVNQGKYPVITINPYGCFLLGKVAKGERIPITTNGKRLAISKYFQIKD